MSSVFAITATGEAPVARVIKLLHAEHAGNLELVLRFFNEQRAASCLSHPGVIEVFGSGFLDGRPYLILERLDGTLAQRGPRLSPAQCINVVQQVADAAAALHQAGIVHRDLKPANIMFRPGPDLVAKIVDLGLAKIAPTATKIPVSTASTAVLGTAEYRAPEAWLSAKEVDGGADVYALGVLLYELLLGRLPFASPRESVLMDLHLFAELPIPHSLSPALQDLLKQMLHKSRERRPSMAAVVRSLQNCHRLR